MIAWLHPSEADRCSQPLFILEEGGCAVLCVKSLMLQSRAESVDSTWGVSVWKFAFVSLEQSLTTL